MILKNLFFPLVCRAKKVYLKVRMCGDKKLKRERRKSSNCTLGKCSVRLVLYIYLRAKAYILLVLRDKTILSKFVLSSIYHRGIVLKLICLKVPKHENFSLAFFVLN
jgi:hypothetical protein